MNTIFTLREEVHKELCRDYDRSTKEKYMKPGMNNYSSNK